MSREDCPCLGRSLGRLTHPAVLAVLAQGDGHGYDVVQRLADLPSFEAQPPDYAGIYRLLADMERKGYLKSRWEDPRAGPSRKVFHLTPSGRACLRQWTQTLEVYRQELDELLALVTRSGGAPRAAGRG